jgi:hypothetical protein
MLNEKNVIEYLNQYNYIYRVIYKTKKTKKS